MADCAMKNYELDIKIAADSIDKLRRCDVYRVLDEAGPARRRGLAAYIKEHRHELADEVDDSMSDLPVGVEDVCIAGSPAVEGICGDTNCVCSGGGK